MYWYKPKAFTILAIVGGAMLFFSACKPNIKETGSSQKYFDIKGYFSHDTAILNKSKTLVLKTVTHNGHTESKKVSIKNWGREFDLFIGSDINKPAWKNSYTIVNENGLLIYKSKEPELHVVQMVIKTDKQKVSWILIYTHTKNVLYQSTEKLTYYPDSLYIIEKDQKVRLMGKNHYEIRGQIKQ
jgi:hypothetical protein